MKKLTRANSRLAGSLLLSLTLVVPMIAWGRSELPREVATKAIDENIARVERDVNAQNLDLILVDALAAPIGDDPRVIPLCQKVIEKSTNPENVKAGVLALDVIRKRHTGLFGFSRRRQVGDALLPALQRPFEDAQLRAAEALRHLGSSYRNAAFAALVAKLPREDEPILADGKTRLLRLAEGILAFGKGDPGGMIKQLDQKHGLTAMLAEQTRQQTDPILKKVEEERLARWRAALQ